MVLQFAVLQLASRSGAASVLALRVYVSVLAGRVSLPGVQAPVADVQPALREVPV